MGKVKNLHLILINGNHSVYFSSINKHQKWKKKEKEKNKSIRQFSHDAINERNNPLPVTISTYSPTTKKKNGYIKNHFDRFPQQKKNNFYKQKQNIIYNLPS